MKIHQLVWIYSLEDSVSLQWTTKTLYSLSASVAWQRVGVFFHCGDSTPVDSAGDECCWLLPWGESTQKTASGAVAHVRLSFRLLGATRQVSEDGA